MDYILLSITLGALLLFFIGVYIIAIRDNSKLRYMNDGLNTHCKNVEGNYEKMVKKCEENEHEWKGHCDNLLEQKTAWKDRYDIIMGDYNALQRKYDALHANYHRKNQARATDGKFISKNQ